MQQKVLKDVNTL